MAAGRLVFVVSFFVPSLLERGFLVVPLFEPEVFSPVSLVAAGLDSSVSAFVRRVRFGLSELSAVDLLDDLAALLGRSPDLVLETLASSAVTWSVLALSEAALRLEGVLRVVVLASVSAPVSEVDLLAVVALGRLVRGRLSVLLPLSSLSCLAFAPEEEVVFSAADLRVVLLRRLGVVASAPGESSVDGLDVSTSPEVSDSAGV